MWFYTAKLLKVKNSQEQNMNNKNNLMWGCSLFIIGIATIIISGTSIIGIKLPDIVVRIIGVIDLISLPILIYSTVKKVKNGKK